MKPILIFDVNETLLDLSSLDIHFEKFFGDKKVRQTWFQLFIQNAFLNNIVESYNQFHEIGLASLEMIANKLKVEVTEQEKSTILHQMTHLSPHVDVIKSLKLLRENEFRLFTLTNSTLTTVEKQLEYAKLSKFFEGNFSADSVKVLKPGKRPYEYVAEKLKVAPNNLMLIAAHAWDIAGAHNVGYRTAFIEREGIVFNPLLSKPDLNGKNLHEIVEQLS